MQIGYFIEKNKWLRKAQFRLYFRKSNERSVRLIIPQSGGLWVMSQKISFLSPGSEGEKTELRRGIHPLSPTWLIRKAYWLTFQP